MVPPILTCYSISPERRPEECLRWLKGEVPLGAGRYELLAVLTHKGRSADSGHYVSWAKQEDGQWMQFDDEEMIPRKEEEVVALSGGGDWHMAYLLLYRALKA